MTALEKIVAQNGSYVMNAATFFGFLGNGGIAAIVVLEDADISGIFTFKGGVVDQRPLYLFQNNGVPAGTILYPNQNDYFKGVGITAGKIVLVFDSLDRP